jgi:hypothetical protein
VDENVTVCDPVQQPLLVVDEVLVVYQSFKLG